MHWQVSRWPFFTLPSAHGIVSLASRHNDYSFKIKVTRPSEYYFKEGCFIEEWHNTASDEGCSIAHVRVAPGKTTKLHALKKTKERYVLLSGVATVTVGGKQWRVTEGDVVNIDADESQKICNQGRVNLLFLAICTPRFTVDNYYEIAEE